METNNVLEEKIDLAQSDNGIVAESINSAALTKTPQLGAQLTASASVPASRTPERLLKQTELESIIRLAIRFVINKPLLLNFLKLSSRKTRLTSSESALKTTNRSESKNLSEPAPIISEAGALNIPKISKFSIFITIVIALRVNFSSQNGIETARVPSGSRKENSGRTLIGMRAILSFVPTNENLKRRIAS